MSGPRVIVLSGHGLNCEAETLLAFERAGARGRIVHVDDLIAAPQALRAAQILALPGGFSFGDHTGAGRALANRLRLSLADELAAFWARETLTIGICNGCQALVKSRLVWRDVSVVGNANGRYECRWVHVAAREAGPWLHAGAPLHLPVAHGEGRFVFAEGAGTAPALVYTDASGGPADGFPANPNGAAHDCAAITGHEGRVLAMMPHPERAIRFTQTPDWTARREALRRRGEPMPEDGDGLSLFRAGVGWFAQA